MEKIENKQRDTNCIINTCQAVDIKSKTNDLRIRRIRKISERLKVYAYSNLKSVDNYYVSNNKAHSQWRSSVNW